MCAVGQHKRRACIDYLGPRRPNHRGQPGRHLVRFEVERVQDFEGRYGRAGVFNLVFTEQGQFDIVRPALRLETDLLRASIHSTKRRRP